jgi:hypothetical protein
MESLMGMETPKGGKRHSTKAGDWRGDFSGLIPIPESIFSGGIEHPMSLKGRPRFCGHPATVEASLDG